jgi:hypothetical protein
MDAGRLNEYRVEICAASRLAKCTKKIALCKPAIKFLAIIAPDFNHQMTRNRWASLNFLKIQSNMVVNARVHSTCSGIDFLLNDMSNPWTKIMGACKASSFLLGSEQDGLVGLIPQSCLQNLPQQGIKSTLRQICRAELELGNFMKVAGFVNVQSDHSPFNYGNSISTNTASFKGKGESSPTNVVDFMERQRNFMQGYYPYASYDQGIDGSYALNFECSHGSTRASKRKELVKDSNDDSDWSRKKNRHDSSDGCFSPKTSSKSANNVLFSPDRQQAASNLVGLKKKMF